MDSEFCSVVETCDPSRVDDQVDLEQVPVISKSRKEQVRIRLSCSYHKSKNTTSSTNVDIHNGSSCVRGFPSSISNISGVCTDVCPSLPPVPDLAPPPAYDASPPQTGNTRLHPTNRPTEVLPVSKFLHSTYIQR